MLSKRKLKATRFFKPYTGDFCTLKSTGAGVYVIKKKDKIVYVGMSSTDVKKTLYRHFQTWNDKRTNWTKRNEFYARITYAGENREHFLIKVIYTPTSREAEILEQLLIRKFKPKDNTLKTELFSRQEYISMLEKLEDGLTIPAGMEEAPF